MKKQFLLFISFLALITTSAFALEIPRQDQKLFHNISVSLKPEEGQVSALEYKLGQIGSDYPGVQMAVLVIDSLESENLNDYSLRVAEQWKLGRKRDKGGEGDKGLLLVITLAEKQYRFEVGYGLESMLPDSAAGTIGRDVLRPAFKDERYIDGIYAAIDSVRKALSQSRVASTEVPEAPRLCCNRFVNKSTLFKPNEYDAQRLESRLQSLAFVDNGLDMAVLVVDSTGQEPLDNFAERVASAWKIGEHGNGVMLVIAMKDRKFRFEVAPGLAAGAVPARLADAIGREIMITDFLAGRYADGIDRTIEAVDWAYRGTYPQIVAMAEAKDDRSLWERISDVFVYHKFSRPTHYDYIYGDAKMTDPDWLMPGGQLKKLNHWVVIVMIVLAGGFGIFHFLLGGAVGLIEGTVFSWLYIGHAWPILLVAAAIGFLVGMVSKYLAAFALIIGIMRGSDGGGFGGGGAAGSW